MNTHENWIHELKLAQLREQVNIAFSQLDTDECIIIDSAEDLDALFNDIQN